MSDAFDPYLKWFGIPQTARPINHYRLLGIEVFETDPEVIENATDQRMAHLKRFSGGQHATLAEQLLNEVAAARVCLLSPDKKAKYDEELRLRLSGQAAAGPGSGYAVSPGHPPPESAANIAFPPPSPQWASAPTPPAQFIFPTQESSPRATAFGKKTRSRQQKSSAGLLAVAAALAALAAVVALMLQMGNNPRREVASGDGGVASPVKMEASPKATPGASHAADVKRAKKDSPSPALANGPPGVRPASPAEGRAAKAPKRESAAGQKIFSEPTPAATSANPNPRRGSEAEPGEAAAEKSPSPEKSSKTGIANKTGDASPKENEPAAEADSAQQREPAAELKKLSPPDAALRRQKEADVREVYASRFAAAATPPQKLAVVDDMLRKVGESDDDPAAKFAILELAAQHAAEAGQLAKAFQALDELDAIFDVNVLPLKVDLLQTRSEALAKAAKTLGRAGTVAAAQQVHQASEELVDVCRLATAAALNRSDPATALRCLKIAQPAARRLKDGKTIALIVSSIKDVEKQQGLADEAQGALAVLRVKPDDAAANLTVGRWQCLGGGDWDKGLPRLAKGGDAELADAAKADLAHPENAPEQIALADRWRSIGEKKSGLESARLKARAQYWYRLALKQSSGLATTAIRKQLDKLDAGVAQYALRFDGATSWVVLRNVFYTGGPVTIEAIVQCESSSDGGFSGRQTLLSNETDRTGLAIGCEWNNWFFSLQSIDAVKQVVEAARRGRNGATFSRPRNERKNILQGAFARDPWTHVAAVYDGQKMRLFVAGRLRSTCNVAGQHNPSPLPLVLGAKVPAGGGAAADVFRGMVRAVRISNLPLYNEDFSPPGGLAGGPAKAIVFKFTEGHGDQLHDIANKKICGEIHGAQWVRLDEDGQ